MFNSTWLALKTNIPPSSMILTRLLWLMDIVRNLVYQTHCIANGMDLPALWREAEAMGNLPARKRLAENLPQLHMDIRGQFPMLGEVWERFYFIYWHNIWFSSACSVYIIFGNIYNLKYIWFNDNGNSLNVGDRKSEGIVV